MGFNSVKEMVDGAFIGGQSHTGFFRKIVPVINTGAGLWYDFSTYGGAPITNFYASEPLVSARLRSRQGIYSGPDQTTQTKYLKSIQLTGNQPVNLILLDYLLYYPFIDGDSTEEQPLGNTIPLPRYSSGEGVKAMLVAQGAFVGNATYTINYTNQDGVAGRISTVSRSNIWANAGVLASSGNGGAAQRFGWHIPLLQGDRGIRSVQSITFDSPNGGIYALVLVKDLAAHTVRESFQPSEKDFFTEHAMSMPVIEPDAYLNFIGSSSISFAGSVYYGSIQTIWG